MLALGEGLNRVGRAPENEVRIEGPTVSACHCEIWLMRDRILLRDLGSTNGTFVAGRPVSEVEIRPGNTVSFGGLEFVVERVEGAGASGAVVPDPAPGFPPAPRFMADGRLACANHVDKAAEHRCPKCGERFCGGCVRVLGRRGGRTHAYCPLCHAECVAELQAARPGAGVGRGSGTGDAGGRGWLAKLTQTLKLGRR